MSIDADAKKDLTLEPEDAENVVGGPTTTALPAGVSHLSPAVLSRKRTRRPPGVLQCAFTTG